MQTQHAGNMLRPKEGILGNNYSLALLSMEVWPVTFGSTIVKEISTIQSVIDILRQRSV